jgi:NACalpha-BTF3-like transcription factor
MNENSKSPEYVFNQANNLEKQSRGERKAIKALENFGFKITNKVTKVKIEKKKQIWIIDNPEVYQSQNYNSLLIFGDAKIGKVTSM